MYIYIYIHILYAIVSQMAFNQYYYRQQIVILIHASKSYPPAFSNS